MIASKLTNWYKVIGTLEQEKLDARMSILEEIYKKENLSFYLNCAKLYLTEKAKNEFKETLIKYFDESYPIYSINENPVEQRILAGAILYFAAVTKNKRELRSNIGLVFKTLLFGNTTEKINGSIIDEINDSFTNILISNREISDVSNIRASEDTEETMTKIISGFNKINKNQFILAEESNCFWWLMNDIDSVDNIPYKDYTSNKLAYIFADNLSYQTKLDIPLAHAKILLFKKFAMYKKNIENEKVKIKDFINSLKDFKIPEVSESAKEYCPILNAISILNQIKIEDAFINPIDSLFKVNIDTEYCYIDFALEIYYELILSKYI